MATGGIATLVLGALLLVDGPIPEMRVQLWTALAVSIPLGMITVFLMTIALKARRNKVVTGIEGLIGEIGTAQTVLAPSGKVFIHGEIWDATASREVGVGQDVVVEKVDGLRLQVTPATSESGSPEKTTA
jgi:membrane-bound serine protease (ClpP class)